MRELRRLGAIKLAKQQQRETMMVAKPFPPIVQRDEKNIFSRSGLSRTSREFAVLVTASHGGAVNRLSAAVCIKIAE